MKKRVLFSLLTIFLAGLGLGGVSMAADAGKVAKIGETEYSTVAEAINNVGNSGFITLIDNTTETGFTVAADKNFILDLNGKELTLRNTTAPCLYSANVNEGICYDYIDGNLTIKDSATNGDGKVIINDYGIMPRVMNINYGKLNIGYTNI